MQQHFHGCISQHVSLTQISPVLTLQRNLFNEEKPYLCCCSASNADPTQQINLFRHPSVLPPLSSEDEELLKINTIKCVQDNLSPKFFCGSKGGSAAAAAAGGIQRGALLARTGSLCVLLQCAHQQRQREFAG